MGLALVMVISLIGTLSLDAEAALSLEGIEEIKKDGHMIILEIVPKEHRGSIGYYVGGQEPTANWYNEVGKENSASEREKYANKLFANLQSAQLMNDPGDDTNHGRDYGMDAETVVKTYPLTYKGKYQEFKPWEVTSKVDSEDLTLVSLATVEEQLVKGKFGDPTENGDYVKTDNYECVCDPKSNADEDKPKAEYIENVAAYTFGEEDGAHYYHVHFQQVFLYEQESGEPSTTKDGIEYICIENHLDQYGSLPL
jgi:hypothetical protein